MTRPAEKATAAAAVVVAALAKATDVELDEGDVLAIAVALGCIPAGVTLLVANGGLQGVWRLLWAGRR